jgi:hypothetical protein
MSRSELPASRAGIGVPAVVLLLAILCLAPLQNRVDSALSGRAAAPDLLYFPSGKVLQRLAFGYDSLLADFYWMRAIQYYGRREEAARRPVRYKNLGKLLDITTTLDPRLLDAFRAGSNFLAEADPVGAGQPEEALRLLDKGISIYPHEWRLQFDKGFVYFWFTGEFDKAGKVWLEAEKIPGAPSWMGNLAAMALSRGGAVETARTLWQRQLQESDRADVRQNAWNHLATIQVNEDLWLFEFMLERYFKTKGHRPEELEELVRAGYLKAIPRDPSGAPYFYEPAGGAVTLGPETKVRYLAIPFDYKAAFRQKLAAMVGEDQK